MRLRIVLLIALAASAASAWAQAPDRDTAAAAGRCDFGLVLSGGGARGAAHIGVLEVLEEHHIRPDCVAGASMGAIIGALYSSGFSLTEIRDLIEGLTWRNIYAEPLNRASMPIMHRLEQERTALRVGLDDEGFHLPRGILHDGRLNRVLIDRLAPASFAAGRDFDRLAIPFRAVGTDLRTGERRVLASGDLALAVRASMSVPLAYPPVRWGNDLLVDGGLVDNLPVGLTHEMGAEFVLAVDVQTPIDPDVQEDVVGVTKRIIDLLFETKNQQYAEEADLVIRPVLGQHSFSDYSRLHALVEAGREAAEAALAQIPEPYRSRKPSRAPSLRAGAFGTRTLERIDVEGNEYLSAEFLIRESGLKVGEAFVFDDVLEAVDHLYSTALVQGAWVDVLPEGDRGVAVTLQVVERYRQTFDLGLAYQSDDQVQGFLRFETRNPLGGGERVQLNTYASTRDLRLGVGLRGEQLFGAHFGYHTEIEYHEERPKYFADGEFINRAEFDRRHVRLGFDLQLGTDHLGEAGLLIGSVDLRERLGLDYEPRSEKKRLLYARYSWDTLDSLTQPRGGIRLRALGERNEGGLGADSSYWRIDSRLRLVRALGPVVLDTRARYGFSSGELPISEWFILGGPELIPGLAREELWGQQAAAASVSAGFDAVSVVRVYGRFGLGGVWEEVADISWDGVRSGFGVGATVATPIGPLQLDYGWAEGGRNNFYIAIGWQ